MTHEYSYLAWNHEQKKDIPVDGGGGDRDR